MIARRILFFAAVPACLAVLLSCAWLLLDAQTQSGTLQWFSLLAAVPIRLLLLFSSIDVFGLGRQQQKHLSRAGRNASRTGLGNRLPPTSLL